MRKVEQRFREVYRQPVTLPKMLQEKISIVSCLSYREEQQVYLVQDIEGHFCVLKRAEGGSFSLLQKEAENLRHVRFSFMPAFVGWYEENGAGWLLREYIAGDTLWEYVEKNGPLKEKKAAELVMRLCDMAEQLHHCTPPVIHRDIKPQNIVWTREGNLFFIDLGTAREFRENAAYDTAFVGTRQTAAPEQYGYRQTDCRTDIYALGVLLLYLLTGSMDIQKKEIVLRVPEAYRRIIETCVQMDPKERYQSCGDLKEALSEAQGELTAKGKKRKAIRRRIAAVCICVALAAAGAACYINLQRAPYQFHSETIEQAVRQQLDRPEGDITKKDLETIESLRICGYHILDADDSHWQTEGSHTVSVQGGDAVNTSDETGFLHDLTDCAKMKNLKTLMLDNQQITDLSPLENLSLTSVSLCGNPVSDLSAFAGMATLKELRINSTQVSDLSVLSELNSLKHLDIGNTQVESIEALKELDLCELRMWVPTQEDMEIIESMPLEILSIHCYSADFEERIGQMTQLKKVTIYGYQHTTLEPLLSLTGLEELDLYGSALQSLEGIEWFSELISLVIGNTEVSDLGPLKELKKLDRLSVEDSDIMNFLPLKNIPSLTNLACDDVQMEKLLESIDEPWFSINCRTRTREDETK